MPIPKASLEVDFSSKAGRIRALNGVNIGPLSCCGLRDLSSEYKRLGFPSTRLHDCTWHSPDTVDIHCIFPLFDADPTDPRNYKFDITDDYIQAILDTGSKVIYRLGETIEHHTRNKYYAHPPRDFAKWAQICVHIIKHYNEGWADGFHHDIKYWEIWNEPWNPPCWTSTKEEYYRLYEVSAKIIKQAHPNVMIGGALLYPDVTPEFPSMYTENMLKHCRDTNTPMDYASWHMYTLDPVEIQEQSHRIKDLLVKYGYGHTETHLNEWNYLPAEGWKFLSDPNAREYAARGWAEVNGPLGAAFVAMTLLLMQDLPIDHANYYAAILSEFGLWDLNMNPFKSCYAFEAFRDLLKTPLRVRSSKNDAVNGYAMVAGLAEDNKSAGIYFANLRAREPYFDIALKQWPWSGKTLCKQYLSDHDRNLALVSETVLDEKSTTLKLCMPAPCFTYITLSPV